MSDVLEELSGDALTSAQVEKRIDNWAYRIDDLYGKIVSWLPAGWSAASARGVSRMHEEPMREVGLPPRDLPVLILLKDGERAATIEPRGLWIIGANGRLDLTRGESHYILIDAAENFGAAQWKLVSLADRLHPIPLDGAALRAVL